MQRHPDDAEVSPDLKRGSILVRAETRLPASLLLSVTQLAGGWNLLSCAPSEMFFERLKASGWKCFYIGREMSLTATGRTCGPTLSKLLTRIERVVEKRECNCIEITGMETSRTLGFSSVRLGAQARHVQKGSEGTGELGLVQERLEDLVQ
jgi:hypothetical protein